MKTLISSLIVLTLSAFLISAEQLWTVTGKVTDEQGNPVAGVTVVIKNSSRGTLTDINGEYKIEVRDADKVLVFSFIGFDTREIKINGRSVINVRLAATQEMLEEVVVTGYGKVRSGKKNRAVSVMADQSFAMEYEAAPVEFNTENYATIHENGYKEVLKQPLSTFSVDVDRASYSNIRRFINMGQMPPKDAVRIEEMINYFSYDYPEPEGEHPFSVYTEVSECPWNEEHHLLHVGLKGKSIEKENLPPSNLVFLIDVSGSMSSANKLGLLKSSFRMLVNELRPEDHVAIVVYAGAAGLVLEPTSGGDKEKILKAIEKLQAGGSTAGGQGLKLAYKVAAENFVEDGNNRIILATDGDFNVGVSSNAEMERLVEKERDNGVFVTVLGFGMGNYKDDKMEIIADKGNGNYAYIDNIQEARKVMISEFGGTLFTIAKDVKFQLEFNPQRVMAYRLIGYENRILNDEDFNDDKKDAGEIGAGHTVTALYELIPAGSNEEVKGIDPLKYQDNPATIKPDPRAELLTIKLRYKKPDQRTSILIEEAIQGEPVNIDEVSSNFLFSAAVAEFGLLLRDSEYLREGSADHVIGLARTARGEDEEGYRGEFIKLVKTAGSLKDLTADR